MNLLKLSRHFSKLAGSHVTGPKHPHLLEHTIGRQLMEAAKRYSSETAVISCHQGTSLSYHELFARAKRMAANMIDLGITEDMKVGVYFANSVEWLLLQMACALSKTVLVTINPAYRHDDLRHCVNSVGLNVLVTSNTHKPARVIENVDWLIGDDVSQVKDPFSLSLKKAPTLKKVFVVDFSHEAISNPAYLDFATHLQDSHPSETAVAKVKELLHRNFANEVTNIQFTSGTTGLPKGAQLTHTNILNNGFLMGSEMGYRPREKVCVSVPLYHCFGMVMGNLAALTHGSTVVYPSFAFSASDCLDAIEETKATVVYGVPAMFLELMRHQSNKARNLSSLEKGVIAGALCPEPLLKSIQKELHVKFLAVCYGMTETSPISFMTRRTDHVSKQTGSVGRILPHLEAKIVNEEGEIVPVGKRGEFMVKGHSVMKGYIGNPEATASVLSDGWMRSGDLAVMDEEGYLNIVGRIKDIINRGGEKIAPKEVEDHILEIDNVETVQVVSVPDERLGEEILALIKLRDNKKQFDIRSVKEELKDKLAHYKVPKFVWVVESLPITATGKPQKFRMRKDWLDLVKEKGSAEEFRIR